MNADTKTKPVPALKPSRAMIVLEATRVGGVQINNPGFRGRNLITPELVGYYRIGNRAVELSMGEFMRADLVGVTVLDDHEASGCVEGLDELRAKLEALK